jgi:hypothetical protein
MTDDYSAVARQMAVYFDGLYHSDTKRLRTVFHPRARYVCATDSALVDIGMPDYFAIVDDRPAPARRGEARQDAIDSIEFAGPKTAFVRARCAIGPRRFTDLLTFIKADGAWRIIAKVFHYDTAPAPSPDAPGRTGSERCPT